MVAVPCPISTRAMTRCTTSSAVMRRYAPGNEAGLRGRPAARSGTNSTSSPPPSASPAWMKPRRESVAGQLRVMAAFRSTCSSFASADGAVDGGANARVGAAAAEVAAHRGVDVVVGRLRGLRQQRAGLHQLARLAVAALRHRELVPRALAGVERLGPWPGPRWCAPPAPRPRPPAGCSCASPAPFKCTVQAPHSAMPQPNLVPVSWSTSRSTHSSGMSGGASTSRGRPVQRELHHGLDCTFLPLPHGGEGRGEGIHAAWPG